MRSKVISTREEYEKISSSNEMKKKEIILSKKELEFIETELATVGRGDNTRKIVEAAGAVAASINAKYEDTRKELEIIKVTLARTKEEYEMAKKEIETLKNKINEKNISSET